MMQIVDAKIAWRKWIENSSCAEARKTYSYTYIVTFTSIIYATVGARLNITIWPTLGLSIFKLTNIFFLHYLHSQSIPSWLILGTFFAYYL